MKRFLIVIFMMVVVAIVATWMLGKYHSTVQLNLRILIAIGGSLLSGVLTFFMSKQDVNRVDAISNKK
ncbi:hypothetical protein [Neobacillus muris]|uniref:hypothetical protein n=1 Tax=Neobacillus muris TaxID=2941334 RepID=UPI00203AAEC3|nr:hypothetical protein [Neobacillus muris]